MAHGPGFLKGCDPSDPCEPPACNFAKKKKVARWFKVTFWSPSWRSLSLLKGHLTIPKRSQRIARCRSFFVSERSRAANKIEENNMATLEDFLKFAVFFFRHAFMHLAVTSLWGYRFGSLHLVSHAPKAFYTNKVPNVMPPAWTFPPISHIGYIWFFTQQPLPLHQKLFSAEASAPPSFQISGSKTRKHIKYTQITWIASI